MIEVFGFAVAPGYERTTQSFAVIINNECDGLHMDR